MASVTVQRIAAGPWDQSCWVVSTASGDAVVVDPGGTPERIAERVAADGLTVHAVLATHGHHDHVGAAAEIVDRYGARFGIDSADSAALARVNLCRFAFHRLEPVRLPEPDIDLAGVDRLTFGELELAVVHTPGHSPGSVCFEAGGVLLTGDTLIAVPAESARMPDVDPDALERSLRLLATNYRSDTVVHPGHGGSLVLGDATRAAVSSS